MSTEIKNFKEGKADTGLLFVAGLFFLTIAFAIVYFSHFGIAPLPKANKSGGMSATAALSLSDPTPVFSDSASLNETQNEEQNQAFISSLPKASVKEIFIGSYGAVNKEILESIRNKVEEVFGVKTTLLNPGPAVPKEEPFYSKNRNQYNSDVLLKSIEQSSAPYGQTVRFLYVVDMDMTSFFEWSPGAPWLRAESGQNAALISLHSFRAVNMPSQEVLQQTISGRAEKAALRALGVAVGFDASPSAADASCVMFPALTLEELDAQGNTLCSPESEAVARVFK